VGLKRLDQDGGMRRARFQQDLSGIELILTGFRYPVLRVCDEWYVTRSDEVVSLYTESQVDGLIR
jgi:hypothetical protein